MCRMRVTPGSADDILSLDKRTIGFEREGTVSVAVVIGLSKW